MLCGVAAFLSHSEKIVVPESGQGALGPSFVTVGQAYDDYRNHPLFTNRMASLIKQVFGHEVRYTFPRLWNTKGETLKAFIEECGESAVWQDTWSCWQSNRHASVDGSRRQCGICAACMLRRLSVHAAGQTEPAETYVWEDLTASEFAKGAASGYVVAKPTGRQFQYAIAGVLHLDHLASLRTSEANRPALDRKIGQLSRSLEVSNIEEVATKVERLLEQHEREWKAFVASLGPESFVRQWALGAKQ